MYVLLGNTEAKLDSSNPNEYRIDMHIAKQQRAVDDPT